MLIAVALLKTTRRLNMDPQHSRPSNESVWKVLIQPQRIIRTCHMQCVCLYYSPSMHMRSEGYSTWSVCVCLSVRLPAAIFALPAMRWPMSDTNVFRTMWNWKRKGRFSWNYCVREICRENKRKSQYAYLHKLTLTDPLALFTLRRHKKSPRRPCIDSCIGMLSYSLCQRLSTTN